MGLFSKKTKDDNLIVTQLKFIDGLDLFFKGELVELIYNKEDKEVKIQSKFENKKTKEKKKVSLNLNKLNKIAALSDREIIEKQKSVGGRALAGGLILGPLGAIVGGMSGVGTKTKKGDLTNYIILNYNDVEVISFEIPTTNFNFNKIIDAINNSK